MANISLFVPLAFAIIIGVRMMQRMTWPTEVNYTHIVQPPPYHAGDVIDVEFKVTRLRTCQLQIERIFENITDRREFIAATVIQLIEKDEPGTVRATGYRVTIPAELKPGAYRMFNRFRYYCIALDSMLPWIRRTPSIELEISP